jgi:hypothetical protein
MTWQKCRGGGGKDGKDGKIYDNNLGFGTLMEHSQLGSICGTLLVK